MDAKMDMIMYLIIGTGVLLTLFILTIISMIIKRKCCNSSSSSAGQNNETRQNAADLGDNFYSTRSDYYEA